MQRRRRRNGRGRAVVFIGISMLAGLGGGAMLARFVQQTEEQVVKMERIMLATEEVVIATRTLYKGLPIQEGDVTVRALAPELVPPEGFYLSVDEVVGRTPRERVLPNEIVRSERLARMDEGEGLNAIVRQGKRAVSIALKAEEAVAGFIEPGDYVDLIAVIRPDDKEAVGAKAVSQILLQGVLVLALGDTIGDVGDQPPDDPSERNMKAKSKNVKGNRTVTLEVTLTEAQQIALANEQGEIRLAMRGLTDIQLLDVEYRTADDLLGIEKPAPPPKPIARRKPKEEEPPPPLAGPIVVSGSRVETHVVDENGNVKQQK